MSPFFFDAGVVPKKWGYEKIIINADEYCGKILVIYPNKMASSVHFHKRKKETFYVLSGCVEVQFWKCFKQYGSLDISDWQLETRSSMPAGMAITIEPMLAHRFWTRKEISQIIEFSTHDVEEDSYRLIESGPAPVEMI